MTHHTDAERAEFEDWARSVGLPVDHAGFGLYAKVETQAAWMAWQWQAARSAPAVPVQMPEPAAWVFKDRTWTEIRAMAVDHNGVPAYTEHQVRQLLAQHGIK